MLPPPSPQLLSTTGLRYVYDNEPGITRQKWGRGFRYLMPNGESLSCKRTRKRINGLAIPPAYQNVWVCLDEHGHLQATGRDEKARKQYRYHTEWEALRQQQKYSNLLTFGEALPHIRRIVAQDMQHKNLSRRRVIATVIALIDSTNMRIGNTEYARENNSYGATTLRKKHLEIDEDGAHLAFTGKRGKEWELDIQDANIIKTIKRCEEIPGYQLFKYFDEDGVKQSVESSDVNDYLRAVSGEEITAKDFRTWAGCYEAYRRFSATAPEKNERNRAIQKNAIIKEVAACLNNTVAICKAAYIAPQIIDAWEAGALSKESADDVTEQTFLNWWKAEN